MDLIQELTNIANAIRSKTGKTGKLKPSNFVNEINNISTSTDLTKKEGETVTPTTGDYVIDTKDKYLTGNIIVKGDSNLKTENIVRGRNKVNSIFGIVGKKDGIVDYDFGIPTWSGSYANEIVSIARSYYDARISNKATFVYDQSGIFEGNLTDSNGSFKIDCSSFISLVLRKLDFKRSPFFNKTGANLTVNASSIGYANDCVFKDLFDNQSEEVAKGGRVRNAATIGEFFYMQGRTVPKEKVMPGDILLFAAKLDDGSYKMPNRFKNISHVGIVAEEKYITRDSNGNVTNYNFYNVTTKTGVVILGNSNDRNDLCLVVRPDYTPRKDTSEVSDINLLPKSYYSCDYGSRTINGMTFNVDMNEVITTTGQPTEGTTFYLNYKTNPIYLKKGTYKLTGCPKRTDTETMDTTWSIGIKKSDDESKVATDSGEGITFEVTDDFTGVYVYLYISATKDSTGYTWQPKLIRVS